MTVSNDKKPEDAVERHSFEAETSRLLHLLVHSVYSEKSVFLRELISNASDACDKLRYEAIAEPALMGQRDLRIAVRADKTANRLTIADNGIGMNRQDMIDNLGTLARSGTARFLENLAAQKENGDKDNPSLIGQFGVGFYSAFMVAERITVTSRRAGENETWVWSSDGTGDYTVAPAGEADTAKLTGDSGTAIELHIRDDDKDYLDKDHLARVIETYSNHIAFPIALSDGGEEEQVNAAGALWTRPKSELDDTAYAEFYRSIAHAYDEPWHTIHYRAEGRHEYTVLLFIPGMPPFDLFDPERAGRLRLYVNRVFITTDAPLLPPYLRFVRGVVDSADMPLTISREMLQNNPLLASIRKALTNRILSELKKRAEKDPAAYETFWSAFGKVLKEGLYEDGERRDDLLALARFRSTASGEDLRTLDAYVEDMKEGQDAIYYLASEDADAIERSPQLEGFRARGIEVLLLTDPVDHFWTASVPDHQGKPLRSVTKGTAELDKFAKQEQDKDDRPKEDAPKDSDLGLLIALVKQALGERVKDVRRSERLTESAVCLVADEAGPDMRMERILARHNLGPGSGLPRILEINPGHALIRALAAKAKDGVTPDMEDAAHLLYDQARIAEGEPVADAGEFARRLSGVMAKALS